MDAVLSKKLFDQFADLSKEDWEKIIEKDLKGADYDKKLIWNAEEDIKIRPYYMKEDVDQGINFKPGSRKSNNWYIQTKIDASDLSNANAETKAGIENGCNAFVYIANGINKKSDFDILFEGIDIAKYHFSFVSKSDMHHVANLFAEYCSEHQLSGAALNGSVAFDPLKTLIQYGHFHQTKATDFLEAAELVDLYSLNLPNYRTLCISGEKINQAGGNVSHEIASSLAMGNEYMHQLTSKGIDAKKVAQQIFFHMGVGSNYFFEIAKLRVLRSLWKVILQQYNALDESTEKVFIHSSTSRSNKSIYDSEVNILRATTEAMSAIIGGTDTLLVRPHNETHMQPNEFSHRVARNIQLVLKEEAHLDKVIDPAAGSHYLERLSAELADSSWKLFQEIEAEGGFIESMKMGVIQDMIEDHTKAEDQAYATRKKTILGTNQYPKANEELLFDIDIDIYTSTPPQVKTEQVLPLKPYRAAKLFESLRLKTEQFKQLNRKAPMVNLLGIGAPKMRQARLDFSENLFGVVGYDVKRTIIADPANFKITLGELQKNPDEITVLCGADDDYEQYAPLLTEALKDKSVLVIAGNPKGMIETYEKQGIQYFIHAKSNLITLLNDFHKEVGIR